MYGYPARYPPVEGHVIGTNGPFCDVLNSGWGDVISRPVDCGIPLKCVTVVVRASPHPSLLPSVKSCQA